MEDPPTSIPNLQASEDFEKKEVKTVFSILSNLPDPETVIDVSKLDTDSDDDIAILRTDPKTKQKIINKNAYRRLHRSLSPGGGKSIEKIKGKYDKDENDKPKPTIKRTPNIELDQDAIKSLKEKYSPANYGYPKPELRNTSKHPVPKPRRNVKSQIITSNKAKFDNTSRLSLNIRREEKKKDENSNLLRQNSSSSDEYLTVVKRSDSEESVDKFSKELSFFTMEKPDKKKRSNSFKKIFSGKLFGKDKKKKEEEKTKSQNKENGSCVDNIQNESNSFNRQPSYRQTAGVQIARPTELPQRANSVNNRQPVPYDENIERQYAQMHINQFNQIKENFETQNTSTPTQQYGPGYVTMDKPIFKCNQPTYMNMPNIRHIDTSSSTSTTESDRSNLYQNEVLANAHREQNQHNQVSFKNENNIFNTGRFRDTPPRADETRCDVKLVNPKALIPINSERPLPNPYQNDRSTIEREKISKSPENKKTETSEITARLEETYGTVLDSIEYNAARFSSSKVAHKPPKSPSLEPTKLKLPPNRDIVALSPRIRSPIPKDDVSTEKIIATELLKPSRSPTPTKKSLRQSSPSHQMLAEIDYPSDLNINRLEDKPDNVSSKPPPAQAKPPQKRPSDEKRVSQASPASCDSLSKRVSQPSPLGHDKVTTNAMVHVNSVAERTPTPNSLLNRSMSPMRPASIRSSTPVDGRISQSPKSTPQKEDMKRSVEAYYWKEIKKLKDQETRDLYKYHFQQNMIPYGYAEDPVSVRRSRSLSPNAYKNSRRSLSLPRDPRSLQVNVPQEIQESPYGRLQQDIIPEGRAVVNLQRNAFPPVQFQQNFRRNSAERRTVDGSGGRNYDNVTTNGSNSLYRPIFKRGSLNEPPSRTVVDDPGNKKVSFHSNHQQPWPTRNGYVHSPPQRRMDRKESILEDDVFMPLTPSMLPNNDTFGYPINNMRYNIQNEDIYYNNRHNLNGGEVRYVSKNPSGYMKGQNGTVYGQTFDRRPYQVEEMYGQPMDAIRGPQRLVRHGSMNMDPAYGQRQSRRASFDVRTNRSNASEMQYINRPGPRREIIEQDEIFGKFGGYLPNETMYKPQPPSNPYLQNRQQPGSVYSSRQSVTDSLYGRNPPKQVSVNNKVCDIYGQIHDKEPSRPAQSGVLVGQLNRSPASPVVTRQSYNQLPTHEQFARNTRLTASANDMYRRLQVSQDPRYGGYGNVAANDQYAGAARNHANGVGQYGTDARAFNPQSVQYELRQHGNVAAPTRPLPPVPHGKRVRGSSTISDTESGSDVSEIRRIMEGNAKTKKKGLFGK